MKTPLKVLMKVQRIAGALSRMSIQNANHLQVYFCEIRPSLIFFNRGTWRYVCNSRTCTQKTSCFHEFLEKGRLSLSAQGKNIMFSGKKKTSFQIIQERSYSNAIFSERPSFQDVWKKKIQISVQYRLLKYDDNIVIIQRFFKAILW